MKNKRPITPFALCAGVAGTAETEVYSCRVDPMSNILPFVQPADPSVSRNPGRGREQLLAKLIALNEEMIEQLRDEQVGAAGPADFLNRMIAQHERAAALLRARLNGHEAKPV